MAGTCASSSYTKDEYNLPLHVGALFIILGVSSFACAFPLLAIRFPVLRIPPILLFVARHFGTGVLIATAFVHLLPTAFLSLSDPCLPKFWNEDYPAMPGAIAMAAVFFVAVAEMVFSRRQGLYGGPRVLPAVEELERIEAERAMSMESLEDIRPAALSNAAISRDAFKGTTAVGPRASTLATQDDQEAQFPYNKGPPVETLRKKALLQCLLLEMGILFHSVFIGMALSVIVGKDFIVLLIAIAFHQSFEGLALGSRIAVLKFNDKKWRPWAMALAYGCTTPIGQAIGLATHTLYSPDSEVGLLMVGIMNAVSSGLLIFASLVELLAEDFLSESSYETLGGTARTWIACLLVFFGAFCMSLVGAWA